MGNLSVWFSRPRTVELRREDEPPVGANDVRVAAIASAISHGTEMLVFRGQIPAGLELDLPTLRGSFDFPIKYGYASVGRVVETGSDVRSLENGDVVFVHHPHQSVYVVPASMPVRLPRELQRPELGVFLANLETAVNIVHDAAPRLGERVVVFGQGAVGLLVTQLLRRVGASQVIAVEPLASRRELACRLGADVALDPKDAPGSVRDLTSGLGADIAIEASGHPAALDLALDSVCFGATIVVSSWYGTKSVPLTLGGAFHRRRLKLISSQVSTIDAALQPRWTARRRLELARDLLPTLDLAALISHRFSVHQAADAYALIDQHPDAVVQVVLTYESRVASHDSRVATSSRLRRR